MNSVFHFNEQLTLMAHVGSNLTMGGVDNDVLGSEISGRLGMAFT